MTDVWPGRIHGHARDQTGRPITGLQVWLVECRKRSAVGSSPYSFGLGSYDRPFGGDRLGSEGEYEIRSVGPGDWWVGISPVAPHDVTENPLEIYRKAELVHIGLADTDREVDLVAYRGIDIQGNVVTPEGEPVPESVVEASLDEDGPSLVEVGTDEQGRFRLGPLLPGRFFVRASLPDKFLPSDLANAMTGTRDLRLELAHGGHLVVSVVDADSGDPVAATIQRVVRAGRVDGGPRSYSMPTDAEEKDTFDLEGLDAGVYDVIARTRAGALGIARDLVVEADGRAREIVIRIESAARVRLTCDLCRRKLRVELYSGDVIVGSSIFDPKKGQSFLVPPGPIRLRIEPWDFQAPPDLDDTVDYWMRKDVRSLDIFATLGEERAVELGRN